ncbi:MAG TPA: branched-chain amino acid ABC transporter permease [Actinomycetota bacterium]
MTAFFQSLFDALSAGSTYVMLALGITLLFGVMGLVNFAYGDLIVWCGYLMALLAGWHVNAVVGIAAVVALATVLSVGMGETVFRPFRKAPPLTLLLASIGVSLVLQAAIRIIFGEGFRPVPTPTFLGNTVVVGGVRMSVLALVSLGTAAVVVAGLYVLLQHTTIGLQMRAYAEDSDVAGLMGVRRERILTAAFALSGVIAGIVAMLWFAKIGTVQPSGDLNPTIKAFIAIVIGGLGSVRGAVIGGLLLGLFESALGAYLPAGLLPYVEGFAFLLIILVLIARPQGVAGKTVELSR